MATEISRINPTIFFSLHIVEGYNLLRKIRNVEILQNKVHQILQVIDIRIIVHFFELLFLLLLFIDLFHGNGVLVE